MARAPAQECGGWQFVPPGSRAPEKKFESVAYGLEILHGGRRVGGEVESAEEEVILRRRRVVDRSGRDPHDRTISSPYSHRRRQLTRFNLVNAHCYGLGFWRRWG